MHTSIDLKIKLCNKLFTTSVVRDNEKIDYSVIAPLRYHHLNDQRPCTLHNTCKNQNSNLFKTFSQSAELQIFQTHEKFRTYARIFGE